jgi:preprotein translocase subunit SecB
MTEAGDSDQPAASPAVASQEVPPFAYQLVDVYLHECSVERIESEDEGPDRPTFETGLETQDRDEPPGFNATLSVEVAFRFRPEARCEVHSKTTGIFVRIGDVGPDDDSRFRTTDCAVLLWPYARAMVGEIVRMTGLELPPLPTVDVRATLANAAAAKA